MWCGPNRTMDSSSPWNTTHIWCTDSNRYCDQLSRDSQNRLQKLRSYNEKIRTMLAHTLSVTTTLCTWSWRRIHRTWIPNTIICHIRDVCTTAKNPQSNAVCERMHQKVGKFFITLLHGEPPQNVASAKEFVDEALSIAMHAMRAGIHSTLGSSPGSLTYNRDMFLTIPLIAYWHAITQRKEHLINENLIQENQKQCCYDCSSTMNT